MKKTDDQTDAKDSMKAGGEDSPEGQVVAFLTSKVFLLQETMEDFVGGMGLIVREERFKFYDSLISSHLSSLISHLSSLISHLSSLIFHLSSFISHLSSLISSSFIFHLSSLIFLSQHKLIALFHSFDPLFDHRERPSDKIGSNWQRKETRQGLQCKKKDKRLKS